MKTRSLVAAASIGFMFLLMLGIKAEAAELKVLSAIGMQSVLEDLGPKFERATGHKLAISFATARRETCPRRRNRRCRHHSAAGDRRPCEGRQGVAGNVTALARAGIGVAVRKGAPKPDISSPDALKRTLLAAKSISYGDPASGGASGIHFVKVLDRLGIANEMKSKTVFPDPRPGEVGVFVANGEAEIVVHIIQELMPVAGIDIVGPLPGDLQDIVVFSAAVMTSPGCRRAKALVNFLRTPEAAKVIKAMGMEPGAP